MELTNAELKNRVQRYQWYHTIRINDEVSTESVVPEYANLWEFISNGMTNVDFREKKVLDIGCRDGLFSFIAERRGAAQVVGIDNNLSAGTLEFLIPHFKSKVHMHEMNLYDLTPDHFGKFDIIMFFGVLYHLRYPFWGLRKIVDCLEEGGLLMIEAGMLTSPSLAHCDFLYCPVDDSPYEPTSCTFFNSKGLETTMNSMGLQMIGCSTMPPAMPSGAAKRGVEWRGGLIHARKALLLGKKVFNSLVRAASLAKRYFAEWRNITRDRSRAEKLLPAVQRQFIIFREAGAVEQDCKIRDKYWYDTHSIHTEGKILRRSRRP